MLSVTPADPYRALCSPALKTLDKFTESIESRALELKPEKRSDAL